LVCRRSDSGAKEPRLATSSGWMRRVRLGAGLGAWCGALSFSGAFSADGHAERPATLGLLRAVVYRSRPQGARASDFVAGSVTCLPGRRTNKRIVGRGNGRLQPRQLLPATSPFSQEQTERPGNGYIGHSAGWLRNSAHGQVP
jgi:hypothetical protein